MNCLVCGHKLAIFRKLSLGDFCCQEHRDLYVEEHHGLARVEATTELKYGTGGTRVYAQFLQDEPQARKSVSVYRGHGPLTRIHVVAPDPYCRLFSQLAPARALAAVAPLPGIGTPIGFGVVGVSMKLPD